MFQVISQWEIGVGPGRRYAVGYVHGDASDLGLGGTTSTASFSTHPERTYFIEMMQLREQIGVLTSQVEQYKEAERLREEKRARRRTKAAKL